MWQWYNTRSIAGFVDFVHLSSILNRTQYFGNYICQEQQHSLNENDHLTCNLQLNGYPKDFTNSVLNKCIGWSLEDEKTLLISVFIPCMKGTAEKFKYSNNYYNIRTVFKIKHPKRPRTKKICKWWHSVSIVCPANVAEATLVELVQC